MGSFASSKYPCSFELPVDSVPVAVLIARTMAPTTAAPCWSCTVRNCSGNDALSKSFANGHRPYRGQKQTKKQFGFESTGNPERITTHVSWTHGAPPLSFVFIEPPQFDC